MQAAWTPPVMWLSWRVPRPSHTPTMVSPMRRILPLIAALFLLPLGAKAQPAGPNAFEVMAFGDVPYKIPQITRPWTG